MGSREYRRGCGATFGFEDEFAGDVPRWLSLRGVGRSGVGGRGAFDREYVETQARESGLGSELVQITGHQSGINGHSVETHSGLTDAGEIHPMDPKAFD